MLDDWNPRDSIVKATAFACVLFAATAILLFATSFNIISACTNVWADCASTRKAPIMRSSRSLLQAAPTSRLAFATIRKQLRFWRRARSGRGRASSTLAKTQAAHGLVHLRRSSRQRLVNVMGKAGMLADLNPRQAGSGGKSGVVLGRFIAVVAFETAVRTLGN